MPKSLASKSTSALGRRRFAICGRVSHQKSVINALRDEIKQNEVNDLELEGLKTRLRQTLAHVSALQSALSEKEGDITALHQRWEELQTQNRLSVLREIAEELRNEISDNAQRQSGRIVTDAVARMPRYGRR
jgi:predicted nuclease with TOPRIM domain